jgi:hypothetical protein
MRSVEEMSAVAGERAPDDPAAFGPVIAHRIARIRARLDGGRYPLDAVTLADALIGHHDRERAMAAVARPSLSVETAVAERLAAAIRGMDVGAMLILQLEFIEQLQGAEIAALFATNIEAIRAVRRSALTELSVRLSAA